MGVKDIGSNIVKDLLTSSLGLSYFQSFSILSMIFSIKIRLMITYILIFDILLYKSAM